MGRTLAVVCALAVLPTAATAQRLKLDVPLDKLEQAARADSNDATAHYNLALGFWSKDRWEDAQRELDETLRIEPRYALAHLARAYLPFARRPKLWQEWADQKVPASELPKLEEINRDYRRAFFFNPLVDLRIVGAVTPPKSYIWDSDPYLSAVYETWVRAFHDFSAANYASAYRRFEDMSKRYIEAGKMRADRLPTDILWYQALSAAQLGMCDVAVRNVTVILERAEKAEQEQKKQDRLVFNPLRSNEYRYVLGVLLARAGRGEEARRHLQAASEADMGLYMAHVHVALMLEGEGRWAEAVAARRAAFAANPEDATSAIELAITLTKAGGSTEPESLLEEVARTQPRNGRAYYLLGLVKQQMGKSEEAKSALAHFLDIAPSRATREVADAKRRLAELQ